ncbi:MAG: hypothetical protein KDB07_07300 [Planctomycetes bacterium]|nr:hypothetical protein [Planctomycetota bacterium]
MKKLSALALLALCAIGFTGCFSLVDMEHNKNILRSWNKDLGEAGQTIDRYFFNYDKHDPDGGYGYVSPNT